MKTLIQWLGLQTLMQRWKIGPLEILQILESGKLAAYYTKPGTVSKIRLTKDFISSIHGLGNIEHHMSPYEFKIEDVEKFEMEYGHLLQQTLFSQEARELGRLRREKSKWHDSITVALRVGLSCAKRPKPFTRKELHEEIYKIDRNIPHTTIETIWGAIPEEYRKPAGRPRKTTK